MSEYLDYKADVEDVQFLVSDLAFKMYNQGRADEQAFVEKRCKELGIDYILIYTCNSAD